MDKGNKLTVYGLALTVLFWILLTSSVAAVPVTVTGSRVNVRSGPSLEAAVLTQVVAGDRLEAGDPAGTWLPVTLPDGRSGYIFRDLLALPARAMSVVATAANSYGKPAADSPVLRKVVKGERFLVTALSADWVRIDQGNASAWLPRKAVQLNADFESAYQPQNLALTVTAREKVNLRKGPSTGYTVIKSIDKAASGKVLNVLAGWVESGFGGDAGWVCGDYVSLTSPAHPEVSYQVTATTVRINTVQTATVTAGILNLRSQPSTQGKLVGKATKGTKLTVLGQDQEWLQVTDGKAEFWVHSDYVRLTNANVFSSLLLEDQADARYITIRGSLANAVLFRSTDGTSIRLDFGGQPLVPAEIPAGLAEVICLGVNQRGVYIDLSSVAAMSVVERTAGLLKLKLTSAVAGVTVEELADRTRYVFTIAGGFALEREAVEQGFQAVIHGVHSIDTVALPAGVTLRREGELQVLSIANPRAVNYLIRQNPGSFTVEALYPGLAGKTVVIDPGHGGTDPGAVGCVLGLLEKDVNLAMALVLAEQLRNQGARVILTRDSDNGSGDPGDVAAEIYARRKTVVELDTRASLTRDEKADIFISVHNNSNLSPAPKGTSTYYARENLNAPASGALAAAVHPALLVVLGSDDFGIRTADFHVIKYCEVPGILLEVLFLSNPNDEDRLAAAETAALTAAGVTAGVEQYFNGGRSVAAPTVVTGEESSELGLEDGREGSEELAPSAAEDAEENNGVNQ